MIESPITINTLWRGSDDAAGMAWRSDDGKDWIDGGRLDDELSFEAQATAWAIALQAQGHDCTGEIYLTA